MPPVNIALGQHGVASNLRSRPDWWLSPAPPPSAADATWRWIVRDDAEQCDSGTDPAGPRGSPDDGRADGRGPAGAPPGAGARRGGGAAQRARQRARSGP